MMAASEWGETAGDGFNGGYSSPAMLNAKDPIGVVSGWRLSSSLIFGRRSSPEMISPMLAASFERTTKRGGSATVAECLAPFSRRFGD